MDDALAIYQSARALLADPARWCKGAMALDEYGQPATDRDPHYADEGDPLATTACRWCLVGACSKVAGRVISCSDDLLAPLRDAIEEYGGWGYKQNGVVMIGPWQDTALRTHAQVMDVLDRAIVLTGGERR